MCDAKNEGCASPSDQRGNIVARASRPLSRERPAPALQPNPGPGGMIHTRDQMTRTYGQDARATAGGTPTLHLSDRGKDMPRKRRGPAAGVHNCGLEHAGGVYTAVAQDAQREILT